MFNWFKKIRQTEVQAGKSEAEAMKDRGNVHLRANELEEAEACYRQALDHAPHYAEAWNNLGYVFQLQGDLENALEHYRKAIGIKQDLLPAQANLGFALLELDRSDEAEAVLRRVVELNTNHAKAWHGLGVLSARRRDIPQAEVRFRRAIKLQPDDVDAHFNLGVVLQEQRKLQEAESAYRKALELKPDHVDACINLGKVLRAGSRLEEAELAFRRALAINPNLPNSHSNLGVILQDLTKHQEAETCFRKALQINPDYAVAHFNIGTLHMEAGRMQEAEESLSRCLKLAPGNAAAIMALLDLARYRPDDPRFESLEEAYAERTSLPMEDRIKLNFAMGRAMENIGQYDRSFAAYEEGNKLCSEIRLFDEAEDECFLEETCKLFSHEMFKRYANFEKGVQDERVPVFIVGMPRSGTTLIEQILASHQEFFGAGELRALDDITRGVEVMPTGFPRNERDLDIFRRYGQSYLDQVWKLAPEAVYISDKMPENFKYLGLIHLMLPNAKIIHAMRDPMDTCFSCYSTPFAVGHEYSFDLEMLGRRFVRYKKLMQHWHSVLPHGRILDVSYENMTEDPEREAKRILEYLGLPWDPACLKFYETDRVVHTTSVAQVRKPIYKSSVAKWRHYEKYLSPLLEVILSS